MEVVLPYLFISILLLLSSYLFIHRKNNPDNLPPSVFPSLPIIGHLYLLKPRLYRTFAKISAKSGPVLLLRLGSRKVLLVSSPSAAEECLTTNDVVFASRPKTLFSKIIGMNNTSLVSSPYGDNWRNLRRITSVEVLSIHYWRQQQLQGNMIHDFEQTNLQSLMESVIPMASTCFLKTSTGSAFVKGSANCSFVPIFNTSISLSLTFSLTAKYLTSIFLEPLLLLLFLVKNTAAALSQYIPVSALSETLYLSAIDAKYTLARSDSGIPPLTASESIKLQLLYELTKSRIAIWIDQIRIAYNFNSMEKHIYIHLNMLHPPPQRVPRHPDRRVQAPYPQTDFILLSF
ncbi:hypothetical protein OSB04_005295 [Centaurea solstitialis]|uniref:Cytochrome P450 n=1 Tax=Centaurea solstitialis TaxID=347529 RepID=A0AA38WPJ4_9ASTR|nr:hypothetical protein OSB04_005295 [Centaurea solstitialis]